MLQPEVRNQAARISTCSECHPENSGLSPSREPAGACGAHTSIPLPPRACQYAKRLRRARPEFGARLESPFQSRPMNNAASRKPPTGPEYSAGSGFPSTSNRMTSRDFAMSLPRFCVSFTSRNWAPLIGVSYAVVFSVRAWLRCPRKVITAHFRGMVTRWLHEPALSTDRNACRSGPGTGRRPPPCR
jgi:hypothetical protein